MIRTLCALALVAVLAACGGPGQPPRNLDNACSIAREKPRYIRAMERTEQKWGVPVAVQMATVYQESRFRGSARTPYRWALGVIPMGRVSSAFGYAQALDGTWDEYREKQRRPGARRNNINDAMDFMGWYMNISRERNGIRLDDARNQYLAYHEGHTGYARGSYRSKAWLLRVADQVAERAAIYNVQLSRCRR